MGYSSFPTILQNGVEAEEGSQNTSWSGIHSGQDTILSQNLCSRGREAPPSLGVSMWELDPVSSWTGDLTPPEPFPSFSPLLRCLPTPSMIPEALTLRISLTSRGRLYSLWRILTWYRGGSSPSTPRGLSFRVSGHKGLAPVCPHGNRNSKELPQRVICHSIPTSD